MSYLNDEGKTNSEAEYTDQEMLLASQSAYLNITEDEILEYKEIDPDGYPSLQWVLTESNNAAKIEKDYMEKFKQKNDFDAIDKEKLRSAQDFIDNLKSGESPCANWKVVTVYDDNATSGMYASLLETSENSAVVAFRGSESNNIEQLIYDYLYADARLFDSTSTEYIEMSVTPLTCK